MGLSIAEFHLCYPQYSNTTLYYWQMKQDVELYLDKNRQNNLGRPRKTTVCDFLQIIATLKSLRRSVGMFSLTDIQEGVDLNETILNNG